MFLPPSFCLPRQRASRVLIGLYGANLHFWLVWKLCTLPRLVNVPKLQDSYSEYLLFLLKIPQIMLPFLLSPQSSSIKLSSPCTCPHPLSLCCYPEEDFRVLCHQLCKLSLTTFRWDAGHTFGDAARPLAPGTKYLGKGCLCHQVGRNSLWNEEKRQYSQRVVWVFGRENGHEDVCTSTVKLSWLCWKGLQGHPQSTK